jgi:phosphatidate cytidylyltransferase
LSVNPVFLLTGGYFAIGAVAILALNRRRRDGGARERWTKFAVYFLIVHLVILAILAGRVFVGLAALILALGLLELIRGAARSPLGSGRTLVAVLPFYAVLASAFLAFALGTDSAMVLFVYVVVLTFDGFSQITGQLLGRHHLAPRVSPGKTIEGLAGGLVMAGVTAVPLATWVGIGRVRALGLALVVAVAALAGDLAASYVKRVCHLKDYATWIPGHGGVLDRFDSFILAGGVYWSLVGR